jgi:NTP pyrophosphatase (non-canonical NTP hydrolase)
MVNLKKLQKEILKNKLAKGFNTTDIAMEFCFTHEELSEAFHKFNRGEKGVGEELADVAIYLLGMSEILGFNLEKELIAKVEKNKKRKFKKEKSSDGKNIYTRIRTDEDP